VIDAAISAFFIVIEPGRFLFLLLGVSIGIVIGILPGLGGLMGLAIVYPFLFMFEPYAGIALLIGVLAAVPTADTFPSVLMGIPGSSGSQATVMDGYPMAQRGEAARALSAAFFASMIGGVIGGLLLTALVPFARPVVLAFGSPELFMLTILGLSTVGILSGSQPLRGLIAGFGGMLLGTVGGAAIELEYRYTMGQMYLWDGIPLVIVALGIFALSEIIDILARGGAIARRAPSVDRGWSQGLRDVIEHRWLVVRHSLIGGVVGFIPGLGGSVVDWINYSIAAQTARKDRDNFGKGDIRGVIAPESANNAKEGGALIPTLLFGVPGSAPMALFLGAMLVFGLQPGAALLRNNLDFVFVIIWSLILASVLATAICMLLARPISMLTFVPFHYLAPAVLGVLVLGAYQATRHWGDLIALLALGLLGWIMKRNDVPRPPLLIGFILSPLAETYLWRSWMIYQWNWLQRPGVITIAVLIVLMVLVGRFLKRRPVA